MGPTSKLTFMAPLIFAKPSKLHPLSSPSLHFSPLFPSSSSAGRGLAADEPICGRCQRWLEVSDGGGGGRVGVGGPRWQRRRGARRGTFTATTTLCHGHLLVWEGGGLLRCHHRRPLGVFAGPSISSRCSHGRSGSPRARSGAFGYSCRRSRCHLGWHERWRLCCCHTLEFALFLSLNSLYKSPEEYILFNQEQILI